MGPLGTQHLGVGVGFNAAEGVGDRADQRIGKIGRPVERADTSSTSAARAPGLPQGHPSVWHRSVPDRRSPPRCSARRFPERPARNADQRRQLRDRVRLMGRHLRADRALVAVDVVELRVQDRIGDAPGRREVDGARQCLPRLVHQAAALVEEALARGIDDDAVGIDQDHRRGIPAARIDGLGMHAAPIAGRLRAGRERHADAVAGVEARSGRNRREAVRTRSQMLRQHLAVAGKAAGRQYHGAAPDRLQRAGLGAHLDAFHGAVASDQEPLRLHA